jgi:3-O-methylgallate 3,4-dioxygenase
MGNIVIGIASSHTPHLSAGVEYWEHHGAVDKTRGPLLGRDGTFHDWDTLTALATFDAQQELSQPVYESKYRRAQQAIEVLRRALVEAKPDVVMIIGDDQWELFQDDGIPTFSFFTGSELIDRPATPDALAEMTPGRRAAQWAAHGDVANIHPTHAELSAYLVAAVAEAGFDVHRFNTQRDERTLGHAFTFPRYRLGLDAATPIVPLFINTYFPPNVPSARRCFDLGVAVARAISARPSDERVAIVTSGGLSHFVINEELDRTFLAALADGDDGRLVAPLTRAQMRSGNSEMLNWVTAAGMLTHLQFKELDYIPAYRSPAGTGTGMAFGVWQ